MPHVKTGRRPGSRRKPRFQVVRRAEIAPLLRASTRPQILSVSLDPSLLETRELLFTSAGFGVHSFLSVPDTLAACRILSFSLIVIGHSLPLPQRQALIKDLRDVCSTPILALVRHGEPPPPDADYLFDPSQSPGLLLEMVKEILEAKADNA